ncbi:hybrid sensor histidine kinase/response regulator [Puteibacter caeruleilacunae]|nr:hybrid sensor histidine kinase/response regulator [Puteibacter caeruleilacunae]
MKDKILIVDDRLENLISLEMILEDFDVEFIRAFSGEEALMQTLKNDLALVILDVQMPGMDGYETLELMRQRKKTRLLPVIFVSAIHQSDLHIIKGIATGAVDFIPKPIIPEILKGKVEIFLELYRQKKELDNLLKDLEQSNTELRIAKEKAEAATRSKSLFLASMTHEIRSPMNGIMGISRLLMKSKLNDEQRDLLEVINTSGENLLQIVNDILDFSKIEAGKVELDKINFNLRALVNNIYHLLNFKAIEKGLNMSVYISPDVPDTLFGDPLRINQVLMNLCNNAVKFTQKGSIKLEVKTEEIRDNSVVLFISIRDTGIGIAEDVQKQLFQEYQQSDTSTSRKFGGTGLGLAISKNLITLMNGDIGVNSRPGIGSEFWIRLELKHEDQKMKEEIREEEEAICNKISILVAEDNPINQKVAQLTLKQLGLQCDIAKNGQEAFNLYKENDYDLILMDMQMPIMDGLTATKEIRAFEKANNVKKEALIVALTASTHVDEQDICFEAGMNDFLSKPFKEKDLKQILKRYRKAVQSLG